MMHWIKSILVFWQPNPENTDNRLIVERAFLERRKDAILKKQASLRVKLASTCAALEQIENEFNSREERKSLPSL